MYLDDYFATFGHDLELAERRQKQKLQENMEAWFIKYAEILCEVYDRLCENLRELSDGNENLVRLGEKTFLYEVLSGAIGSDTWDRKIGGGGETISAYHYLPYQQLLKIFLENRGDFCRYSEAAAAVRANRPLYGDEGRLSRNECGEFWRKLLQYLPPRKPGEIPLILAEIVTDLETGYTIFSSKEEEVGPAAVMLKALSYWWLEAEPEELEDAPEELEDAPEEEVLLLAQAFPELENYVIPSKLQDQEIVDLFGELYPENPDLVIKMWRYLLDRAGEELEKRETAECLLYDDMELVWNGETPPFAVLLAMKADDRLAHQVFGSGWFGTPLEDLLDLCDMAGEPKLRQHLEEILKQNPAFKK